MSGTTDLELPQSMRIEDADAAAVPAAEAPERPERMRNPRDEAMERIARHYEEKQLGHELAVGREMQEDAAERGEPQPDDEPGPRPSHAEARQQAEQPQAPQTRTVSIQGQPFGVTDEQYARLAEMGALANIAMQQEQMRAAQQPPQQPHYQQPQAYQPPQGRTPAIDEATARQALRAISYGDETQGAAALQYLMQQAGQANGIDADRIRSEATAQALQTIELNNNLGVIGREYPEVFGNRSRAYLAAIHLTELRQRDAALGRQTQPLALYREACNMVRDAIGGSAPAESSARLERKRAAPRNPTAASRAASLGPSPQRSPSGSEIVDQIRRARGQMPMG